MSFDAPLENGGTLHERIPDSRVRAYDQDAESQNTIDAALDMLEAVLEASIGLVPDPKLVPPHLSHVFSASITGERTRQLLQVIYKNADTDPEIEDVLSYIFGLQRHRQVQSLELLTPARQLWPGGAAQQNAWTLLNRARTTLRANLLVAIADHNEDLFLRYLFLFGFQDKWRKGTVDRLAAWREQLSVQAPEQACALAALATPAIYRAVETISKFPQLAKQFGTLPTFTSVYTTLRYAGLFSHQDSAIDIADILFSARSKLPQNGPPESLMLQRALERPLHLLHLPEAWDTFIDELLNWIEDPQDEGTVFAAYTACYYLDSLDACSWQGIADPLSLELAWTNKAIHTVLEESDKNLNEPWYCAPHQAAINMLRAINYLRAHPDLPPAHLGRRARNVCLRLARKGMAASSQLSHPRVDEIRKWSQHLERRCSITF